MKESWTAGPYCKGGSISSFFLFGKMVLNCYISTNISTFFFRLTLDETGITCYSNTVKMCYNPCRTNITFM